MTEQEKPEKKPEQSKWSDEEQFNAFRPPIYLNGFPKSGLHMLECMMWPLAKPMPEAPMWDQPWAGTFTGNSWTTRQKSSEKVLWKIGRLLQGHYLLGHCGYRPEIERFIYYKGCTSIFIFRDFRDVVVSQAHHVTSDDDTRYVHPSKHLYQKMDSFDEVLTACIKGIGRYPGVMERWQHYAPWLDVDWIMKCSYESVKADADGFARNFVNYFINRVANIWDRTPTLNDDAMDFLATQMVQSMKQTQRSATFRRGVVGGWKEVFTREHIELFKETDTDGWLVKLGYEQEEDW